MRKAIILLYLTLIIQTCISGFIVNAVPIGSAIVNYGSTDELRESFHYVEIFDPKKDKVVKLVQLNPEIQNMVKEWVSNIESLYGGGIDPVTDDGYAVKVPIDPPFEFNNDCLKATISEVYILIPEKKPPFFMIFENETKLTCFAFTGSIATLSNLLDFKLSK